MIFLDTNIVSETLRRDPDMAVLEWLARNDEQIALPSVTLAELAYGIAKIRPDQRADRLEAGLLEWRQRFSGRIFALTEDAAIAYGAIMGRASRSGRPMSVPDGMIAAIAHVNGGQLATRNLKDFQTTELVLISPWEI